MGATGAGRGFWAWVPELPGPVWRLLGLDSLSALGSGLTLPFLIVYLHEVQGLSLGLAGAAAATIGVASLAGNPIGGTLADRLGPRGALRAGLVVAAAGAVVLAMMQAPWQAFVGAGLAGAGASVAWPAQDALMAGLVPPPVRSLAFGLRHATLNLGLGAGGLVASVIVDVTRPETFVVLYALDAATFVVAAVLLVFIPAPAMPVVDAAKVTVPEAGYRDVLRDRRFLRLWWVTAVLAVVGFGSLSSTLPGFALTVGASERVIGMMFVANTVTVVVAQLPVMRLIRRRRRTTVLSLVGLIWGGAWVLVLFGGSLGGPALVAALVATGVTFAAGETLMSPTVPTLVNDLAPPRLVGRYNGAATLAYTTGFVLAPLVGGVLLEQGLGTGLLLAMAGAALVAAVGARRLGRHLPPGVDLPAGEGAPDPEPTRV